MWQVNPVEFTVFSVCVIWNSLRKVPPHHSKNTTISSTSIYLYCILASYKVIPRTGTVNWNKNKEIVVISIKKPKSLYDASQCLTRLSQTEKILNSERTFQVGKLSIVHSGTSFERGSGYGSPNSLAFVKFLKFVKFL